MLIKAILYFIIHLHLSNVEHVRYTSLIFTICYMYVFEWLLLLQCKSAEIIYLTDSVMSDVSLLQSYTIYCILGL